MGELGFGDWLLDQGYAPNTVRQMLNRVQRIRAAFGELERLYATGELGAVHGQMRYTTSDTRVGRPNPTPITIDGDLRTGLAVYASTLRVLTRYFDSRREEVPIEMQVGQFSSTKAELADDGADARSVLANAALRAGLDFAVVISRCAWFLAQSDYAKLDAAGATVWFPSWRRAHVGEIVGRSYDGIFVDGGQKAEIALKLALLGRTGTTGHVVVHVWPETAQDPRFYSHLANLVMIPSPVAALLELFPELHGLLQRRAYDRFNWRPEGVPKPAPTAKLSWRNFNTLPLGRLELDERIRRVSRLRTSP